MPSGCLSRLIRSTGLRLYTSSQSAGGRGRAGRATAMAAQTTGVGSKSKVTSVDEAFAIQIGSIGVDVGWIGTGVMGASMCGHVLDGGHRVTLTTRTRERAEPLLARGA